MSTSGETADLLVKESIQITESSVKLAGLGAKNLAALLLALANDQQKIAGKTNLKRLIQSGEEISLFSIKQEDLSRFQKEAKRYGILYSPILNRAENTGLVEIMARSRDARQINHVLETMGCLVKEKQQEAENEKKSGPRAPSERSSEVRGNGVRNTTDEAERISLTDTNSAKEERGSVKVRLSEMKSRLEEVNRPKLEKNRRER